MNTLPTGVTRPDSIDILVKTPCYSVTVRKESSNFTSDSQQTVGNASNTSLTMREHISTVVVEHFRTKPLGCFEKLTQGHDMTNAWKW